MPRFAAARPSVQVDLVESESDDELLAARREPVPLHEAAYLPLIGVRLHRCRMHVDAGFDAYGLTPRYVFRTDDNGLVHSLVAAGMGVGIIPHLALDPRDSRLAVLQRGPGVSPGSSPWPGTRDRHRTTAAEAFISMAQQLCAE